MYLSIIIIPGIASLLSGFFGRFLGPKGSSLITTTLVGITCFLSLTSLYEVGILGSVCEIKLAKWIESDLLEADWGFLFDSLTVSMLVIITSISTLVHLYSIDYMSEDPHLPRFMSYLSFFTFLMIILVTADNYLQMFVGWEGVGLCSYLLINFWFTRIAANKSAMKAIIVNRIGDFGLILGIIGLMVIFKSVDYETIFSIVSGSALTIPHSILTLVALLLFIGAVGKSAQIGLHTWLPDAMEGPTPVSALIHAATMVTAGVFLIIRSSPLFIVAEDILVLMTIMGSLTALFAATSGLLQNDLKRVIAYSTCSQLGYMVFACGIASFATSFFHLANHAFFKALLFLSAGAVIHALGDEQDMRKMGGLIRLLPFTYVMILIGSLSLMGFPFLTGYYSKDVILESTFAYSFVSFDSSFAYWLGTISAFFTAFYSIRLIYLTFITDTNAYHSILKNVHEVPIKMAIPLMILAFGSIFIGFLTKDLIIGFGTPFWNNAIVLLPNDAEFLPFFIKLIPVIFSLLGAIIGYSLYSSNLLWNWASPEQGTAVARFVYSFFNQKWYFDQIYNRFCVQPLLKIGYHTTFKLLDKGIIEILGPYGIASIIRFTVDRARNIQSGLIYHYTFIMVSGLILLLLAASQKDAIIASFPLNDLLLIVLIGIIIVQINTTTSRL